MAGGAAATGKGRQEKPQPQPHLNAGRPVILERIPLSTTCVLYRDHVLVDPTAEEEALAGSVVTVVMDQGGELHGEGIEQWMEK